MANENTKILFSFQQLVKSDENLKTVEENIRSLINSMDDARCRAKEAGELLTSEEEEFREMGQLLYKVKNFIQEQEFRVNRRKCKVGYELDVILAGYE